MSKSQNTGKGKYTRIVIMVEKENYQSFYQTLWQIQLLMNNKKTVPSEQLKKLEGFMKLEAYEHFKEISNEMSIATEKAVSHFYDENWIDQYELPSSKQKSKLKILHSDNLENLLRGALLAYFDRLVREPSIIGNKREIMQVLFDYISPKTNYPTPQEYKQFVIVGCLYWSLGFAITTIPKGKTTPTNKDFFDNARSVLKHSQRKPKQG